MTKRNFLLIGHRGVGKSTFLRAACEANPDIEGIDLDSYIELKTGNAISDIFSESGEDHFRILERKFLLEILASPCSKSNRMISLGAGCDTNLTASPQSNCQWVWIQRETDLLPRVFLNRPRLQLNQTPREEYHQRFFPRETQYSLKADLQICIPEGANQRQLEKACDLLFRPPSFENCFFTVKPTDVSRFSWQWAGAIEVRNDHWLSESLEPKNFGQKILWSIRQLENIDGFLKNYRAKDWIDIDRELILNLPLELVSNAHIISSHTETPPDSKTQLLKWSPLINSWEALIKGHNWWSKDPARRSFLPRSENGQWQWYRLFQMARQKINFARSGRAEVSDQPTFYLANANLNQATQFLAVLGDPVSHSWSPEFHREFANELGLNFYAIPCLKKDFSKALAFLAEIGLKGAAVTSPLKTLAAEATGSLKSINTMLLSNNKWLGQNTDNLGLRELLKDAPNDPSTIVWGGGGILDSLFDLIPKAQYFSARTGQPRDISAKTFSEKKSEIKNLVWAAGPTDPKPLSHGLNWNPEQILDLNYREDSVAKEWALVSKIKYQSGESMFKIQGLAQQKFWSSQ